MKEMIQNLCKRLPVMAVLAVTLCSCDSSTWSSLAGAMAGAAIYGVASGSTASSAATSTSNNYSTTTVTSGYSNSNYITPPSDAKSSSATTTSQRQCYVCKGTGRVVHETYMGSAAKDKYCSECGKTVHAGHSHIRCSSCNGKGYSN